MDERKRNILIIAATTAAVVLMVVANIAFILMHPSGTDNRNKLAASDVKAETSTSTPAARHQKPLEVCEKLAPKAAATYTSKAADRDRLIKRYFASDAQGLNIPIDRIADQPDVQASGGMNAGTSTTATCSVWTGLESPWTLTWRWAADKAGNAPASAGRSKARTPSSATRRRRKTRTTRNDQDRQEDGASRSSAPNSLPTSCTPWPTTPAAPVDAPHSRTPARMAGTHRLVAQRADTGLRRGWSGAEASRIHAPSPPRRHTIRAAAAGRRAGAGTVSAPAEQSPPDDSAEKALKDADDDFAALERIADLESDTADIPPIPEAESSGRPSPTRPTPTI